MELNHGLYFQLKLIVNMVSYKIQQARLTTKETQIVQTSYGKVCGIKRKSNFGNEHSYYAFEGIPYAKPPVGKLRFRAPQPPDPWNDILDCKNSRSKPVQVQMVFKIKEGSEDCLYLNVYAKKLKSNKPLPVMVWIYGGGFQVGEASRELYSPEYFMHQDVIIVTFNYRVGVLGFLCFDTPDINIPGNAGIKDQLLALKWVKENIAHFNGDPNNITVFGESAGAVSTHLLMLAPRAEGLFHKAILQSGSVLCHWGQTERHDWGYKLAQILGYKGNQNDAEVYKYLLKQNAKSLTNQDKKLLDQNDVLMNNLFCAFVPVIEPYDSEDCIVCRPINELLPIAWGNKIPLIIGANKNEGLFCHSFPLNYPFLIDELDNIDYVNFLPAHLESVYSIAEQKKFGQDLKDLYFNGEIPSGKKHLHQYLELSGDKFFWIPVYRTIKARCLYARDVPTFCYYFEFDSAHFNHARQILCSGASVRGTSHADDLSYLFGNLMSSQLETSQKEYRCMQRMISMWYNFALNSNPNCKEIAPTVWSKMDTKDNTIQGLIIADTVNFAKIPCDERLRQWQRLYERISKY